MQHEEHTENFCTTTPTGQETDGRGKSDGLGESDISILQAAV